MKEEDSFASLPSGETISESYLLETVIKKKKLFMKKQLKSIPKFHSEEEEQAFWAREDSSAYIDWKKAKRVTFSHLKPTTKSISIRLPLWLLERLKARANENDIPYQSYVKMLLYQGIHKQKK